MFSTVVALGVLVVLAPYAVEMLGFGELGPLEGEFCFFRHRCVSAVDVCADVVLRCRILGSIVAV